MPNYTKTTISSSVDRINTNRGQIEFRAAGTEFATRYHEVTATTGSFFVSCSANTNGNLAPTNSTGSYIRFFDLVVSGVIVLFTTASNSPASESLWKPAYVRRGRKKTVTASITYGQSADSIADTLVNTITTYRSELSASYSGRVTPLISASKSGPGVIKVVPFHMGRVNAPVYNSQLTSSYGFEFINNTGSGTRQNNVGRALYVEPLSGSSIGPVKSTVKLDVDKSSLLVSSSASLLYLSSSGKIGFGTKDPKSVLDIQGDTGTEPADIILRTSKPSDAKIAIGDETGRISFLIESSSFRVGKTKAQFIRSGSSAEIFSRIIGEDAGAAYGSLIFSVNDEDNTTEPIEALTIGHNTLESVSGVTLIVSGAMKMAHNNPRFIFEDTATGHQAAYIGARSIPNADDGVLELYTGGNKTVQIDGTNGRISGSGEVIGATGSFGLIEGGTF